MTSKWSALVVCTMQNYKQKA